jgi:mono/diheme cytochrome c family protein
MELPPVRGEEPSGGSEAAGVYRRYCQRCHGADGTGQRGADDIPNFTSLAWQKQRDDAALRVSILDGKGTVMPAFQGRLSEAQARSLVTHIRAFAPALVTAASSPSAATPVSGNDFTAQFRQLQEEFDGLQRQLRELDSAQKSQPTSSPRSGGRHAGPSEEGSQNKRSWMAPGTHIQASSTVVEHRRASADDRPAPREPEGLTARIRPLFSAKCAECHGAHLTCPKGKFGYVLDLERIRSNPKLVVPYRPDESKLWALIRDNEMPPENSEVGLLTAEEKELVRDWISAGAPAALPHYPAPDCEQPAHPAVPDSPRPAIAPPSFHRLLGWLGRFHIPALHFPIALFLAAVVGELWCLWWRIREPWPPVRFCVLLGAAGAALVAVLGWLHADFGGFGAGSPTLLGLHRWLGTLGGFSAAAAAVASEIDARRRRRCLLFRIVLFAAALLIGVAGHFGGSLVHGEDFFFW